MNAETITKLGCYIFLHSFFSCFTKPLQRLLANGGAFLLGHVKGPPGGLLREGALKGMVHFIKIQSLP